MERGENKLEKEAIQLYKLNERALKYRNSKQYFIGDRIVRYGHLIRKGHFLKFFKQIFDDAWRVIIKKKTNPSVDNIDFENKYKGSQIAVYTAIYGKYDHINEPMYKDAKCDYYIFTDMDINVSSYWKKIEYDFPKEINTPFLKNRYVKMLPHKCLKDYRYSIYIDGNLTVTSEISIYFNNFNCKSGIGMHLHPSNTSIYEEVKYNLKLNKISQDEARKVINLYKKNKMPSDFGMTECNVILRDSNNYVCNYIMDTWWKYISSGVKRDQLYFTFVLYILGYTLDDLFIISNNINANPMFIRNQHI